MSMDIKVDLVNFNWMYESGTDEWNVDTQHRLERHWHIGYSESYLITKNKKRKAAWPALEGCLTYGVQLEKMS